MNVLIVLVLIPLALGQHFCQPGSSFQCPDSATCCQLLDKSYGCCPLKNAVCCDDHIHCCPINTKCSTGMCIQQNLNQIKNSSAHVVKNHDVVCPGAEFTCPDSTTCCDGVVPGTFGCCPLEDAVCCKDKQHCCPSGTVCDLDKQSCIGDLFSSQMYDSGKKIFKPHASENQKMVKVESSDVSSVICPGSTFQCPDSYTCCMLKGGDWGCCPFPKATCCNDGLHCCPESMVCDPSSSHCSQGLKNLTSVRSVPATAINVENIICPDKSKCQDSMTCCKLSDTKFGCCQYQNATCCSDDLHCCPSGNKCDVKNKRCIPEKNLISNEIL